jgi:hypothetical protein
VSENETTARRVLILLQSTEEIPPSDALPGSSTVQATALVQTIADRGGNHLSSAELAPLVQAVAEDIEAGADKATVDGERLARVETQTRALAEAVLAITETAEALAPAVKAVKDGM